MTNRRLPRSSPRRSPHPRPREREFGRAITAAARELAADDRLSCLGAFSALSYRAARLARELVDQENDLLAWTIHDDLADMLKDPELSAGIRAAMDYVLAEHLPN